MNQETLIRVHRDEKDIGYFTPDSAREFLETGILREDDWAFCDGLEDWTSLGHLLNDPSMAFTQPSISSAPRKRLPKTLSVSPASTPVPASAGRRVIRAIALLVAGVFVCCLGVLLFGGLFNSSSTSSSSPYTPTPMPHFEGDSQGNATPGDIKKGAEWLLEQDRLRTARTPSRQPRFEPLTGRSPEAEVTIRDIEAMKPGYLKSEDRELIRALILTMPDPGPNR